MTKIKTKRPGMTHFSKTLSRVINFVLSSWELNRSQHQNNNNNINNIETTFFEAVRPPDVFPYKELKSAECGRPKLLRGLIFWMTGRSRSDQDLIMELHDLASLHWRHWPNHIKIFIVNFTLHYFLSILIGCSTFFNQSESSNPEHRKIVLKIIFIESGHGAL